VAKSPKVTRPTPAEVLETKTKRDRQQADRDEVTAADVSRKQRDASSGRLLDASDAARKRTKDALADK
jgi:hypothetical protein